MKILYFECFSGITGGMALGALMDMGVEPGYLLNELHKLNLSGWTLWTERVMRSGINANCVRVVLDEPDCIPHQLEACKGESTGNYEAVVALINASDISERAKEISRSIALRAVGEGLMASEPLRLNSVIEIVGCAICVDFLNPEKIYSSAVNEGSGFAVHPSGQLPIPSPAVVEIFEACKAPFRQIGINAELITPVGAAVLTGLAQDFGPIEEMSIEKTGYGAGIQDFSIPNVLRIYLAERRDKYADDSVWVIESVIDNTNPEILGYVMEQLLSAGARDVYFTNIMVKKNRPAVKLTVLCITNKIYTMEKIILGETGSSGIMRREETRTTPDRKLAEVKTQYGNVKVRVSTFDNITKILPEYDDAKKLALKQDIPLYKIYEAVGAGELI